MTVTIATHIDGPNFYESVRDCNGVLDYLKLRDMVAREGDLRRMYYYTAVDNSRNSRNSRNNGLNRLLYFLGRNGYEVVTKPVTKNARGTIVKGNMDVDITVGLIRTARQVSDLYLMSGDGDFAPAIEAAKDLGARVTVISTKRLISPTLIGAADFYLDLEDVWGDVKSDTKRSG